MGDDDTLAETITTEEGVLFDSELLADAVEGLEGASGFVPPMNVRPNAFDSIPDALIAYKEGALYEAGKGKNRGYTMTVGFGVAGILSLVTGGILMANNRPVLGSIGIGASAGCGVGSFLTYPKTVPFVGYHLRVDEGMYVSIRLPKGLSDESFTALSAEQEQHKVSMDDYSVPTLHILEQIENRQEHSDELDSGLDPDEGFGSQHDENEDPPPPKQADPQPDPLVQKEAEEAEAEAAAAKAKKAPDPSTVLDPRTSAEKDKPKGLVTVPGAN